MPYNVNGYLDYIVSNLHRPKYIFMIQRTEVDGEWFLIDVKGKYPYPVIWTAHKLLALAFTSEEEVEEFKYAFVSPRPCEIIRIVK